MMKMRLFFALVAIAMFAGFAGAATYYLDANNGNDSWPGTNEQPWKTLAKAQATAVSGDTVIVRNGSYGVYSESAVNRTDWVTYRAAEGQHPVLDKIKLTNESAIYDSYLVFDGFNIRPGDLGSGYIGGVHTQRVRHIRFYNLDVEGCDGRELLINLETGSWPAIRLDEDSNDVVVNNCKIYTKETSSISPNKWGFSCGVRIYKAGNVEVSDCNILGGYSSIGIISNTAPVAIKNNDVFGQFSDGIVFGGCNGLTIENNKIHDLYVYKPALAETPTDTNWNEDGTVMTNPNAKWNTAGDNKITNVMEIEVISGTDCNIGDNDYQVLSVDPSGTQITLSKGIANGGRPQDVNYFFKVGYHADLIQAGALAHQYDITIRGNQLYNLGSDKDQTFMWLSPEMYRTPRPGYDYNPTGIGGHKFLIENNLCWTIPANEKEMQRHSVSLNYTENSTVRNNTIIGQLAFYYTNAGLTLENNIANYIDIRKDTNFAKEDYDIFNYGYTGSHVLGAHTSRLFPAGSNNKWNDPAFTGIFADYANGDFKPVSAESLAVGHADAENYPATDILGNPRDSRPDAGAYEFQGSTPAQPCTQAQLLNYIFQWKQGGITMATLMQKVASWKIGSAC